MENNKHRRPNGDGNIRKITVSRNGKKYTYWQGRILTDKINRKTGEKIRKTITGKTQAEVAVKLRKIACHMEEPEPSTIRLREWLAIWEQNYLVHVKASTRQLYHRRILLYIIPELGNVKLCDLSTAMIQEVISGYAMGTIGKANIGAKTIKDAFSILRSALDQAMNQGYIPKNPMNGTKLPSVRRSQRKIHPMREEDIVKYVDAIKFHRHEELYMIALLTGMREGELLGVLWENVDLFTGTIVVSQQLTKNKDKGGEYYIDSTKNDKIRTVHVGNKGVHILKQQQMKIQIMKSDAGEAWQEHDLVFPNTKGCFLSYRTVYDCHKRICQKIGCPETRFHDLRHTYATIAIKSGVDMKTLQENLGHSDIDTTLNIYGHVFESMRKGSAEKVDSYFNAIPQKAIAAGEPDPRQELIG